MSIRVTNSMLTTNVLADLRNVTSQLLQTQNRLSSGKQIQKPSDDPFGTARALQLRSDLAANEQYQKNVNDASAWQNTTDTALGDIGGLTLRARDLVVQAGNGSLSSSDRLTIAAVIDQIIESVKTAGNTEYAGTYVFSGSQTTTPPYKFGADDTYYGDAAQLNREIGPGGVQVQLNVTGSSVIGDGSTPGSLLTTLRTLSTDLKTNNEAALQTTDLAALDTANDTITETRAAVGARSDRLTTALNRLQQLQESTTQLLSNTEDADMAQLSVDFSQQQAVYTAALKAGAGIIQPSLMDFLH